MTDSDDRAWLDGLTGRADDSPDSREAAALRLAMQKRSIVDSEVPLVSPTREAALLQRARRDGPPLPRGRKKLSGPATWLARLPLPLVTAGAAGLALIVGVLLVPPAQDETVRGGGTAEQVLESTRPQTLRDELVDALLDAGVNARGYTGLDEQVVVAELPQPLTAEVRRVLLEHNLAVPADGELMVRIRGPVQP